MTAIYNSFFGSHEGPPFKLIKEYEDGLEVREYEATKWVSTKRASQDQGNAGESGMFWRLFNYIGGENDKEQTIAMTVPVSTKVDLDPVGKDTDNNREMGFYIGKEHSASPPGPSNESVFIVERKPMTVYTRKVGGYMKGQKWAEEAEIVKKMILKNEPDAKIDETEYFLNGYDAPFKFFNRRNEVWWVKAT